MPSRVLDLARTSRRSLLLTLAAVLSLSVLPLPLAAQPDPLPSWNDDPARQAILDLVAATITEGGPDFVAPTDRIAVLDQDGTTWTEQPLYGQGLFALDRLAAMAPDHPEWKTRHRPERSVGVLRHHRELVDRGGDLARGRHRGRRFLGQVHDHEREAVDIGLQASDQRPSAGRLATASGLSLRTLQRRLAAEGTSFSALLEDIRREQALQRLAAGVGSLANLSASLGYRRQSALTRAVRHWTGGPPSRTRRSDGS